MPYIACVLSVIAHATKCLCFNASTIAHVLHARFTRTFYASPSHCVTGCVFVKLSVSIPPL